MKGVGQWAWKAACADPSVDRDWFFGEDEDTVEAPRLSQFERGFRELQAKAVCNRCPVKLDCLSYAMGANEFGIWGGMTWAERKDLRRRQESEEVRRQIALRLVAVGATWREAAEAACVSERTVRRWREAAS